MKQSSQSIVRKPSDMVNAHDSSKHAFLLCTRYRILVTIFLSLLFSLSANAYFFEAKPRGRMGTRSDSEKIFAEKSGIQAFTVTISASLKERPQRFKLLAVTILKANQRRRFHFACPEVATAEISCIPGRRVSAEYVTCRARAVDDNWKDVSGDWSRGLVVLGTTIEILDENGKRVFAWGTQPGVYKKGIKEVLEERETAFQAQNSSRWDHYLKKSAEGYNYWLVDGEKVFSTEPPQPGQKNLKTGQAVSEN